MCIVKGVRFSAFPCANVPTLEGLRCMKVTCIEPRFLVSRLLTYIMTDVMADCLCEQSTQRSTNFGKLKNNLMIEMSTLRTMRRIAFLTSI